MRITIVMPTYNGIKFLEQAVNSVLAQNHREWELIISDDNSTDETRGFLSKLKDTRIRIHFQPRNFGIFGNLNFLFSQADGEIIQILCQDDYFVDASSLERLSAQWSMLPQDVAFLRCNHLLDSSSRHALFEGKVLPPIVNPEDSDLLFFIFGCIPGNLSNVSVRTGIVEHAGWFRTDLPYAGDFEFWSRLGRSHRWALSKVNVTKIRSHAEQASKSLNARGELLSQIRQVLEPLYENLTRKGHSATLLRLEATINYVSQHRDIGVKAVIKRKGSTYLRKVSREFDSSTFSVDPFWGWLTYFVSMGGRLFANSVAKRLLNEHLSAK